MTDRRGSREGERGQTTHDFAIGISIFLLTAVFVVTFVPNVTTPFATGITEIEQEQSQGAARLLVSDLSTSDASTALNTSRTDAFFDQSWDDDDLQERLALPSTAKVNITVRATSGDGTIVPELTAGDIYRGEAGATSVRIVTYNDQSYRLEVRVW